MMGSKEGVMPRVKTVDGTIECVVGWTKSPGGYAQVGVTGPMEQILNKEMVLKLMGAVLTDEQKQAIVNGTAIIDYEAALQHLGPDEGRARIGYFATFDRRETLEYHIRQCQKAGRDAFGRSAW